jgi:hypothetical protein
VQSKVVVWKFSVWEWKMKFFFLNSVLRIWGSYKPNFYMFQDAVIMVIWNFEILSGKCLSSDFHTNLFAISDLLMRRVASMKTEICSTSLGNKCVILLCTVSYSRSLNLFNLFCICIFIAVKMYPGNLPSWSVILMLEHTQRPTVYCFAYQLQKNWMAVQMQHSGHHTINAMFGVGCFCHRTTSAMKAG